jgi:hypothetical protein
MGLTGQGPTFKPPKRIRDTGRLGRLASMRCIICDLYGLPQNSATQVHHCIHERHGTRRSGDDLTIPLCEGHHLGMFDKSKVALHREPDEWRRLYGDDYELIEAVNDRL